VLAESARIVRGKIDASNLVSAHDLQGLVIPGGFGVVKNLCTYGVDGIDASVNADVERLIRELHALRKPIGAICIAPVLVALVLRTEGISVTIGNDGHTALALERLGAHHHETRVDEIHVDKTHNIISTPAFMLAHTAAEAETGITRLVEEVLKLVQQP
jgi:enhancing lycopene biosynthesis protein 2